MAKSDNSAQDLASPGDAATRGPTRAAYKPRIHLTRKRAIAFGRQAFLDGKLLAQQPEFVSMCGCAYRGRDGLPCIIGASISDRAAEWFDNHTDQAIEDLVEQGFVRTDDQEFLQKLQSAHDHGNLDELAWLLGLAGDAKQSSTTDSVRDPGMTNTSEAL